MKHQTRIIITAILSLLMVLSFSCSEKEYTGSDPSEAFVYARKPYDDKNYDIAIKKLDEFKSRFPYSKFTALADLYIANSHFELQQYDEAAVSYSNFVKLHPKHEMSAFAMYRVGESYWANSPSDIDRDQDYTQKAITEWGKLIERFPNDPNSVKAHELVLQGKRRIAQSHEFIATFYCKMEIFPACAYRSLILAKNYPEFKDIYHHALKMASKSFDMLADQKAKDPESDKNIYFKTMTVEEMKQKAIDLKKEGDAP